MEVSGQLRAPSALASVPIVGSRTGPLQLHTYCGSQDRPSLASVTIVDPRTGPL
jgi:hypothetical protein